MSAEGIGQHQGDDKVQGGGDHRQLDRYPHGVAQRAVGQHFHIGYIGEFAGNEHEAAVFKQLGIRRYGGGDDEQHRDQADQPHRKDDDVYQNIEQHIAF